MRRGVFDILAGLALAILAGAIAIKIFGVPVTPAMAGETAAADILRTVLTVAAFALPAALLPVWLAEARRVRGAAYWLVIGILIGALGYIAFTAASAGELRTLNTFAAFAVSGALGGLLYWWAAGKRSGTLMAAIERESRAADLDEAGLRRRCSVCTAVMIALGVLPFGLIGWHLTNTPQVPWPQALAAKAESSAAKLLSDAGMPWASLKIDNHVGRLTGMAADAQARTASYEKAKSVLASMIGLPGVVAYLQNDLSIDEGPARAAEAKRKADEAAAAATAKARAVEQERLAAKAKRKGAAKLLAAKQERLAAEAKRKAREEAAAAKARALAEQRHAAEVKRKADDEAAAAARARAIEEERLATEAKRKTEEDKRLELEAEREHSAVAAARKAEAEKSSGAGAAAPNVAPAAPQAPPTPASPVEPACDAAFADVFKSIEILFPQNGTALNTELNGFFDNVAKLSQRCADYSIEIGGHADKTGSEAINLKTSLARAVAVRDALAARGMSPARMYAKGFGNSRPLNPARSSAAYKLNRRVEMSAIRSVAAAPPPPPPPADAGKPKAKPLDLAACHERLSRVARQTTIYFSGNASTPLRRTSRNLGRIAHLMLRCSNHALAINGHADRRGTVDANQKLSDARAASIRDALVKRGVPAIQLSAVGHGALMPIASGNTAAAYASNRRVDFDISVAAPPRQ